MSLLKAALLIYLVYVLFLYLMQDRMIFFQQPITEEYAGEVAVQDGVEEVKVAAFDNSVLHGWLVKNNLEGKSPLLIYFGGNAEELSYLITEADKFDGYSLLLMNYRGYGLSEGSPNEEKLCKDAVLIYDEIMKRDDIDENAIVVMGRSIGTGVAVQLAKERDVKGVILVTPFDSLVSVAQEKMRFIPVSLFLRNRFVSVEKAPGIEAPLLALIAERDEIVPPEHAFNLVNNWGGEAEVVMLKGETHNTVSFHSLYWESIGKFLQEIR